jgi:hypothetical protein
MLNLCVAFIAIVLACSSAIAADPEVEQFEAARQLRAADMEADRLLGEAGFAEGMPPALRGMTAAGAMAGEFLPRVPPLPGTPDPRVGPADWPVVPYALPTISMRLRAVLLADDNGTRRVQITPSQVKQWVDRANLILASAGIRLDYDPAFAAGDTEYYNSTLLNSMSGNSDANWNAAVSAGKALADQTPGRMLVLFRWGPGGSPTGGGFSWSDLEFVAMPGFNNTFVCGVQNIGMLAHEVGHYLGLPHTFTGIYASVATAQTAYINSGRDAGIFNNDGRDETEPDPFVDTSAVQCSAASVTLDGTVFTLPRPNAMSYYHPISEFTPSQAATMRQVLLLRSGQSLTKALRGPANAPIEAESRSWSSSFGGRIIQNMSGFLGRWSGNTQLLWIDGNIGSTLTTSIPVAQAGRYRVYASFTAAPDFGIHRHAINNQNGEPIDLYASVVLHTGPVYLGTFNLISGSNTWRVTATGTNARSNPKRYGYGLDYILLEKECRADFDGDGFLTFEDVDAFVSAFESGGVSADFNADGFLTFEDFDVFVGAFEAGC